MSIASKISSTEITQQLTDFYVDNYFEIALVNSPGTTYEPGVTNDATFMANEVTYGTAGYSRQVISYSSGDIAAYADKGMALARKAAIFDHDAGATALSFSHIAVLRGQGNILTLNTPSSTPTNAVDGTYPNLTTYASSNGKSATLDLVVSSSGTVFTVTLNKVGYNYTATETLNILESDLINAGVCGVGDGNLTTTVATVTTGGGTVYSVSKPATTVNLTDGNQAVMYFDIKHFGFYN